MDTRLSVSLPSKTAYVYGTVNGETTTWTRYSAAPMDVWETVAPRAPDDVYRVALKIYRANGSYYEAAFTVYYGVVGLIYDRTQADVSRVSYLAGLDWANMSEAEKAEWASDLKGAYNASDLNRVGTAVDYVAKRLRSAGYSVPVEPKTDWRVLDIPTAEQMQTYLDNVRTLRAAFAVPPSMPAVPEDMDGLDYIEANNIERILYDLNALITNIMATWVQSGMVQSGQWWA